jgi:uncharacterized protein with NRDE domain
LTVLPSTRGTIVSMNRDEADSRAEAGEHLEVDEQGALKSWWPIDSVSHGTWFGVRGDGLVAALLNRYQGAGNPPQRSRGVIIPWLLQEAPTQALEAFIHASAWQDFAPFDLVLVHGQEILQCSWEKERIEIRRNSGAQPFFLSSSSVEYETSLQIRRAAFERFVTEQEITPEQVISQLHRQPHTQNSALGFLMQRPGRSTKSISQAIVSGATIEHRYIPLDVQLPNDIYEPMR